MLIFMGLCLALVVGLGTFLFYEEKGFYTCRNLYLPQFINWRVPPRAVELLFNKVWQQDELHKKAKKHRKKIVAHGENNTLLLASLALGVVAALFYCGFYSFEARSPWGIVLSLFIAAMALLLTAISTRVGVSSLWDTFNEQQWSKKRHRQFVRSLTTEAPQEWVNKLLVGASLKSEYAEFIDYMAIMREKTGSPVITYYVALMAVNHYDRDNKCDKIKERIAQLYDSVDKKSLSLDKAPPATE